MFLLFSILASPLANKLNLLTCLMSVKNLLTEIFQQRSSHRRCSLKIGIIKNFPKFTGKHLHRSLRHRFFPVNFAKLLRPFYRARLRSNTSENVDITLRSRRPGTARSTYFKPYFTNINRCHIISTKIYLYVGDSSVATARSAFSSLLKAKMG